MEEGTITVESFFPCLATGAAVSGFFGLNKGGKSSIVGPFGNGTGGSGSGGGPGGEPKPNLGIRGPKPPLGVACIGG